MLHIAKMLLVHLRCVFCWKKSVHLQYFRKLHVEKMLHVYSEGCVNNKQISKKK